MAVATLCGNDKDGQVHAKREETGRPATARSSSSSFYGYAGRRTSSSPLPSATRGGGSRHHQLRPLLITHRCRCSSPGTSGGRVHGMKRPQIALPEGVMVWAPVDLILHAEMGSGAKLSRGRAPPEPGPLLALPRRKPSCRLTPCAGSPATATYLHRVGTLRPPPAFAASGPPRPPPVFVVPETHGRHLSRRTREQEGPRPPPRRPSTRARASLPRTPETCRRLIRRVGWRWEGVVVAALLNGEVEGDEAAGESSARRAPADGARPLAVGE
uniref:Uncharacterized protein n=1 Tax=Oryza barthii TaxID=65489 RepID=A0A0D3FSK6_9ORYZ